MSTDTKRKEFIDLWDKKAEEIQNLEEGLTKESSNKIYHDFTDSYLLQIKYSPLGETVMEIDRVKNNLNTALAIAESNYRAKHKTWFERLIDSIRGFSIFKW